MLPSRVLQAGLVVAYFSLDHLVDYFSSEKTKNYLKLGLTACFLALVVWSCHSQAIEDSNTSEHTDQLRATVRRLEVQLDSNLDRQNDILLALATNKPPNLPLLTAMADTQWATITNADTPFDTSAWERDYQNRRNHITLQTQQAIDDAEKSRKQVIEDRREFVQKYIYVYDYMVRKFEQFLIALASQRHVEFHSDCHGLTTVDSIISSNYSTICSLSLGTNANWNFHIVMHHDGPVERGHPVELDISNGNSMLILLADDLVAADLYTPNTPPLPYSDSVTNYQRLVDDALHDLLTECLHKDTTLPK